MGEMGPCDSYLQQALRCRRLYKECTAPLIAQVQYFQAERSRLIGDYDDSAALHSHAADIVKRSLGKEHPTLLYAKQHPLMSSRIKAS